MTTPVWCPDCGSILIKAFIECEDRSGWFCGWLCKCQPTKEKITELSKKQKKEPKSESTSPGLD